MKNKFLKKISDITHLHRRAAFSDLPDRLPSKESTFMGIARDRYSCRTFKDTPLTDIQIKHILEAARLVFMVGAKPEAAWVRKYDGKNGAEVDAAIVGTHIMLEASALGLGNVWVGSFDPAKIKADFPETAGYEVVALFPVGHADIQTSANHDKRQSSEEFVSFI